MPEIRIVINLRHRMYLIESLFRNDIENIRQFIQKETEERKEFMESVDAFMKLANNTLLTDSRSSGQLHEELLETAELQTLILRHGVASLKNIYKNTNKTIEQILAQMKSLFRLTRQHREHSFSS